jgi:hypothetical protein
LIALTSFYSPVRRKAGGYLFLTPRRQKTLSESLRLCVLALKMYFTAEASGRARCAAANRVAQEPAIVRD